MICVSEISVARTKSPDTNNVKEGRFIKLKKRHVFETQNLNKETETENLIYSSWHNGNKNGDPIK